MSRAVAKAQKRVAELAGAAEAWITTGESSSPGAPPRLELHKRGTRKLRRAMAKLERAKRAAENAPLSPRAAQGLKEGLESAARGEIGPFEPARRFLEEFDRRDEFPPTSS